MVDTFKEFVKKQKSLSSEVMRVSVKPLHKVCNSNINCMLNTFPRTHYSGFSCIFFVTYTNKKVDYLKEICLKIICSF